MFTFFRSLASLIIFPLVIISGCQSARELHYFKSDGNYYRLKINEKSFASKARYLSGYFDERAVDKYFSEMSQPDSAKVVQWLTNHGENVKLVMILSTNSNSISEQIGNLANNEDLLETVARLANKDKIAQSNIANSEIDNYKSMAGNIAAACTTYFATATVTDIKTNISDFLSHLKGNARGKLQLENLNAAIAKYTSQ
ncbi:MAG: hypothetical protein JNK14_10220 [Chitinophagaceae bacterium]|nr:hypothetical protein [Chitinophagaceae bacterium]